MENNMNLYRLDGRVAIVTGSSRGIGRSIAENLARCGARVVISSRKAAACEDVAAAIRDEGGDAIAIAANISDKTQVEQLVAQTRMQLGPIDILVCNAATNPYYGPSTGLTDEVFDKVMRNNVLSNLWLANLVRADMAPRRDGAILIVSSIGGMHGSATIGAYNVSKAADMQLVRNLAVEWGPDNIRVNCIAPGVIRTDFARAIYEDPKVRERIENELPLRRIGEPDDIGGIAVMLCAPAGKYVTGQTIVADGGWMVR
jgi:NAD(P)-dependent dehydrogenase (short-subunit alcohol dehydrogenase family)